MARIDPVSDAQAGFLKRLLFRAARSRVGAVPEPLRIMAHSPSVMWGVALYELASGRGRAIPARLRDLAALKVASLVGCVF